MADAATDGKPRPNALHGRMDDWIENLFQHPELAAMGHHQRIADANLGLGWIYYGLARTLRPAMAVVIGSWRGFVPLVLAKALADNAEGGTVVFIEPSLVDDFWRQPPAVADWFARFGAGNIRHYAMTTQDFVASADYRELGEVGMLFVDGYHSCEQARFDHEAFGTRLSRDGIALFHDSRRVRTSRIYGDDRAYEHRVKDYVDALKRRPDLQVLDLSYADGVSLVRSSAVTCNE